MSEFAYPTGSPVHRRRNATTSSATMPYFRPVRRLDVAVKSDPTVAGSGATLGADARQLGELQLQAARRVTELVALEDDWDSYGASQIRSEVARRAFELVCELLEAGVGMPFLVPASDGGIQLEWHAGDLVAEIEVASQSRLEIFVSGPTGATELVSTEVPADMVALLVARSARPAADDATSRRITLH